MYFRRRLVSTCLVAVLALPAALQASETVAPSRAVDLTRLHIDNFGRLSSTYYRGEQPTGGDYQELAALGIRTVIDLQADGDNSDEAQRVEGAGMTFYRIPMTTHAPPTAEQIALFLQIVNDPARQPVYVHCAGGRHRTGVMTAVYRMEHDGWSADQAFAEMKRYRFGWDFLHPEFKEFVYGYESDRLGEATAAQPATSTK